MNTKVIYFTPNFDYGLWSADELAGIDKDELLHIANNSNEVIVYDTLHDFELAFNNDCISDMGYIFFI